MTSEYEDLSDMMELLDFTLSSRFVQTWRHKYPEHLIKLFQSKLLETIKLRKPIKVNSLVLSLKKNNKYSDSHIWDFFKSIQISLYSPIIQGKLKC
jgi:hypothetical protein